MMRASKAEWWVSFRLRPVHFDGASCASDEHDPDWWTTDEADIGSAEHRAAVRRAKQICGSCVALDSCRQYGMAHPELYGVWGGMDDGDRKMYRQRKPVR